MESLFKRGIRHKGFLGALGSAYLVMLASMLVPIAFVPLYLAQFGQYQFGVLMILLSLVNFAVIGIAWMSGGAARLLGEYAGLDDAAAFRRAYGVIKAIYVGYGAALGLVIALIAFVFDDKIFSGGTPADVEAARNALALTGLYLIFFFAIAVDRLALASRKQQAAANLAQLAGLVVFALGTGLWLWRGGTMVGVLAIQALSALASLFVSSRALKAELAQLRMRWPGNQDVALFARLGGRTGAGFFIHGMLVLALVADTLFIGWLGGAAVAAEFYLLWKIGEVLVQLLWKVPETLAPYFVQMDVRNQQNEIDRIARLSYLVMGLISLVVATLYGIFGYELVSLWVGESRAPHNPLGYALAGGAIFWLGLARVPVILANARVALRPLNVAGGIELAGKVIITLALFPWLGYIAVLLAINAIHLLASGVLYFRLLRVSPPEIT